MKWLFLISLLASIVMLLLLKITMPASHEHGVVQLVWVTDDNPTRQEQMRLFRAWYRQHYGEKIDILIDPDNGGSNKIIMQSCAGAGPDLFDFYGRLELERYVKSGIVMDITDVAQAKGFGPDLVWPAIRPSFTLDGRQYGFPDNATSDVLLYHKDLFDEAGVPYPQADWTWQDFLKIAPRLTRKRADGLRQFALLNIDPLLLIYQSGAHLYSEDGTRCTLNTPDALQALQLYVDLCTRYHVMPTPSDVASQAATGGWGKGNVNLFAAKFAAMTSGARWWFVQYAKNAREAMQSGKAAQMNIGVAEIPRLKYHYGMGSARLTGVNRNSPRAQYAVRFLEFLATESFNREVNEHFDALAPVAKYADGFGTTTSGNPPPGLTAVNDPLWLRVMGYSQEVERSPFIPPYRTDALWAEVRGKLDAGDTTPAETLRVFSQLVNAEIARNIQSDPKLQTLNAQLQGGKR